MNAYTSFRKYLRQHLLSELSEELLAPSLDPPGREKSSLLCTLSPSYTFQPHLDKCDDYLFARLGAPWGQRPCLSLFVCSVTNSVSVFVDWLSEAERTAAGENNSPSTKGSLDCNQVTPTLASGASWLNYCSKRRPDPTVPPYPHWAPATGWRTFSRNS